MTTNIQAVYEGGILRPLSPLPLAEGETVDLTVASRSATPAATPLSEDEIIRRIDACKTVHEWIEVTTLLPPDDGGYDIVKSLDENRRWLGERPILPDQATNP